VIAYNCMPAVRNWDGSSYDRISGPMEALGRAVLSRLPLRGDELVLDAGCGSGRITAALLDRLPRGKVIAVDLDPSMINAANERLGGESDGRLELRRADILELECAQPLDAILSTATFHWIADHERLFRRLHGLLREGGQLIAQCGGRGNIDLLRGRAGVVQEREPYAAHFRDWAPPWNYAAPAQTRERLLAAGLTQAECWLEAAPAEPEHAREFLQTIVLGPHVQQLPEELRESYMDAVMEELGEPVVVDYVRLNIDATA
jgi:trans-aconitate 2-methyltransferase